MSLLRNFIKNSSFYLMGEVLITAAGFISFPVFARILTKEEYGLMSLITITLSIIEELSSAGLRHATQRFYPSYLKEGRITQFYSTTIFSSIALGVSGTVVVFAGTQALSYAGIIQGNLKDIFAVASLLVTVRILMKVTGCIYRVREDAKKYSAFAVLSKYAGMVLSIVLVSYFLLGVFGFYLGLLLGEVLILVFSFAALMSEVGYPKLSYSRPMFKEMSFYGFPLVISGLGGMILTMGDRYMIGYFLTTTDVAVYSVYYNLCVYLTSVLVTAFEYAFIPLIMNAWVKSEQEHIQQLLQKVMKLYCIVALPVIFGVYAVGEKLVVLLASDKYAGHSHILPYIITGEVLRGLLTPLVIGLHFHKNTNTLLRFTWMTVALSVGLNLVLIPSLGLMGAAISTLVSYGALLVLGRNASARYFKVQIPWTAIARYGACAALMFACLKVFTYLAILSNMYVLVLCGIVIYAVLLLAFDGEVRTITSGMLSNRIGSRPLS